MFAGQLAGFFPGKGRGNLEKDAAEAPQGRITQIEIELLEIPLLIEISI